MAANGIQKLVMEQTKSIETELGNGKLHPKDRVTLESIRLILIVLSEDHPRISTMWIWFRPTVWLILATVIAVITALATGHIHVVASISQ